MAMQLWNGVKFSKWKVVRNVLYLGGTENENCCTAEVLVLRENKEVVFQEVLRRKSSFPYKVSSIKPCGYALSTRENILSFEVSF